MFKLLAKLQQNGIIRGSVLARFRRAILRGGAPSGSQRCADPTSAILART